MSASIDLKDKLMSVEEAVRRFVKDGDMIAVGGFTINRNPMASRARSSAAAETCTWWRTPTARRWTCSSGAAA